MKSLRCFTLISAVLFAANLAHSEQPESGQKTKSKEPDKAALEKAFVKAMTNVTLVGHFTIEGENNDKLREERYTIDKVTKANGDYWIFLARIKYGKHNVKLPLPLRVKWAGDTPVITVTDVAIPGIGTYTARVVIHRGQYAGTWSGKDHGGQLFGKVVKNKEKDGTKEKKKK